MGKLKRNTSLVSAEKPTRRVGHPAFDFRAGLAGLEQGAWGGIESSVAEHLNNAAGDWGWRSSDLIESAATEEAGKAANWAHKQHEDGSTEYNYATKTSYCKNKACYKCNYFVGDAYTKGGGLSKSYDGVDGYPSYGGEFDHYADANDMANDLGPKNGYNPRTFEVIPLNQIRKGDVVAFANASGSGHMGVMGSNRTFISAYGKGITAPDLMKTIKDYKKAGRNVVVRRYKKF